MQPYYERWRDAALTYIGAAHVASERKGIRVCVVGGTGHGDKARQLAFCGAVRRKYPDADIFFLGLPFAAASGMVDYDMAWHAKQCGAVDAYYFMQAVDKEPLIQDLVPHFDVVFDTIPYAVGTFWNQSNAQVPQWRGLPRSLLPSPRAGVERMDMDGLSASIDMLAAEAQGRERCRQMQYDADQLLAPFRWLYDGYPELDWRLRSRTFNIWEVMARTSGIDVDPWDLSLATPIECAPWPDEAELTTCVNPKGDLDGAIGLETIKEKTASSDESYLDLGYVGDYVMVHNSAGRSGRTKIAPPSVFKAIVAFLESEGIRSVQIGQKGEQKIADTVIDRRAVRLPLVNQIMARPDCLGLIGIDSLPPYMAQGMGKPAMVLWGSTMRTAFGLPMHLNHTQLIREGDTLRPPCPIGTCFRMPGYGHWCLLDKSQNETPQHCINTLPPEDAARAAVEFATHQRGLRDGTAVPEEAVA